jgi:hypothetical protein
MEFVDDTSKEIDKAKLISTLSYNLKQVTNKTKQLNILTYVMHQCEIYFNSPKSGSIKKEVVMTILSSLFNNDSLLEHSIEYILKENKIFKKNVKTKISNFLARRQLKKKLKK